MIAGLSANGHRSLFISLEMTRVQLGNRLVAGVANTTYAKASFEENPSVAEHHRITKAMKDMNSWPLEIYDPPTATIAGVCSKIREAGKIGCDTVFIDYIVVCLAQLRRESERSDKPKLSDLRESGQLEQDADAVALIHRPDRDSEDTHERSEILIAKNRNGPTGFIKMVFDREAMKFTESYSDDR
jgi:replicative DNA helicase